MMTSKKKRNEYSIIGLLLVPSLVLHTLLLLLFTHKYHTANIIKLIKKAKQQTKILFVPEVQPQAAIVPGVPVEQAQQHDETLEEKIQNVTTKTQPKDSSKGLEPEKPKVNVQQFKHGTLLTTQTEKRIKPNSLTQRIKQALSNKPTTVAKTTKKCTKIASITHNLIKKIRNQSMSIYQKGVDRDLTANELKDFHYMDRIGQCWQTAWSMHFKHLNYLSGKAYIRFVTNMEGKLVELKLLRSSGNQELDDAILKSMQLAAPFPPIPKSLNTSTYTQQINVSINSH